MKALLDSPLARALLLGLIVAALQIPSCMIGQVGRAREATREEALAEISSHWGGSQNLFGPFLVVPWTVEERATDGSAYTRGGFEVVAPERLEAVLVATVEIRDRGLFHVPVYRARAQLRGHFPPAAPLVAAREPRGKVNWDEAQLVMRLSDVRAIDELGPLTLQGRPYAFKPGGGALASAGLNAKLPGLRGAEAGNFEFEFALRGSGALQVTPAGLETDVTFKSNWPDPAFRGAWLPVQRTLGAEGFTAHWHVPYVARGLPASWTAGSVGDAEFDNLLFGASFVPPLDAYRMTERSLKYSPLFTGLAFLMIWLFEVAGGARVQPVQYLLVGASLCLFYMLELSLAEHLGFGIAYFLAASAVTTQVTLYSRSALDGRRPLVMCTATALLYGLLYLLLREDDYALLVGSVSLFIVLSAVMFLTRGVRWGAGSGEPAPAQ